MNSRPFWLPPVNAAMGLLSRANRILFERGWRTRHRVDVPVISVGNIALGGTGKTPLVAALAKLLHQHGARPAVLTRGYGRAGDEPVVINYGDLPPWRDIGDEPTLLAQTLPHVPILVDTDRVRSAANAIEHAGATHLLLDDGFQHWRLHRDLDLVAVNADDPLACRTLRREPPSALARADAVVVTRTRDVRQFEQALEAIRPWAPAARVIATSLKVLALRRGATDLPASTLVDLPVVAVAGIGSPEGFVGTLDDAGARIVDRFFFPDHHPFTTSDLEQALEAAARHSARVVTTEKDFIRIPPALQRAVDWLRVETVPWGDDLESVLAPLLIR